MFVAFVRDLKAEPNYEQYLRCYKGTMNKVLCDDGYEILIRGAYYADNGPVTRCRDSSIPHNLCKEDIRHKSPGYYAEILSKCNGYRACRDLVAGKTSTSCNSFFNPKSDYVLLEYSCLPVSTIPPSTTTTTTTTSTSDGQISTVSENTTQVLNGSEVYNNGSISISGVTQSTRTGHQPDSMLAVKIVLPLLLLILAVAAVLVILLLLKKRRKQAKSSSAGGVVFTNANYENSSTLQVRQNTGTELCNASGQTVNFNVYSNDEEIAHSQPARLQNGSAPASIQSNSPYVDMTFSKNKIKAWFKNRTSKLRSRKEQTPPASRQEPEPQPAEAIYAGPMEVCGTPSQSYSGTNRYLLQQSCDGLANMSSTVLENDYAPSPEMANSPAQTNYISMNNGKNAENKMLGQPLPPTVSPTPTKPEDVEGLYSSPKNNKPVYHSESTDGAQNDSSQIQIPTD